MDACSGLSKPVLKGIPQTGTRPQTSPAQVPHLSPIARKALAQVGPRRCLVDDIHGLRPDRLETVEVDVIQEIGYLFFPLSDWP